MDAVLRKPGPHDVEVAGGLLLEHLQDNVTNAHDPLAELQGGRAHVIRGRADQRDPLLEELVEVRREDGQEPRPLEQRRPLVQGLLQDAPVELEPAEVAIEPGPAKIAGLA